MTDDDAPGHMSPDEFRRHGHAVVDRLARYMEEVERYPVLSPAAPGAVREALKCKEEGASRTILFNLCGHGHFDMAAYEAYFGGKLEKHELTQDEIDRSIAELDTPQVA